MKDKTTYLYVFDFDQYTGNFHRELASFIIGYYNEHCIAEDERCYFLSNGWDAVAEWFNERLIKYIDDEHGPAACEIVSTNKKNWTPNAVSFEFNVKLPADKLDFMKMRIYNFQEYSERNPKLKRIRLFTKKITYTEIK